LRETAWWSWEDSNLQPSGYCQEMGEAQCNHSANIDHRLTKKPLAAISVGETVAPLYWGSAKYWSEWQDLNLRPLVPNEVVKVHGVWWLSPCRAILHAHESVQPFSGCAISTIFDSRSFHPQAISATWATRWAVFKNGRKLLYFNLIWRRE
jgi:hypothetical protein